MVYRDSKINFFLFWGEQILNSGMLPLALKEISETEHEIDEQLSLSKKKF
jgi:hypothetical protein